MKTMTREIRFKAIYRTHDGQEIVRDWYFLDQSDNYFYIADSNTEKPDISEVIRVFQFTGLHDSKGTPIYEGDRIRYSYPDKVEELGYGRCEGIVTFENGCFVVKQEGFDYEGKGEKPSTLHEWLMDDDCEVVGEAIAVNK